MGNPKDPGSDPKKRRKKERKKDQILPLTPIFGLSSLRCLTRAGKLSPLRSSKYKCLASGHQMSSWSATQTRRVEEDEKKQKKKTFFGEQDCGGPTKSSILYKSVTGRQIHR
jgi:hypothetical protein